MCEIGPELAPCGSSSLKPPPRPPRAFTPPLVTLPCVPCARYGRHCPWSRGHSRATADTAPVLVGLAGIEAGRGGPRTACVRETVLERQELRGPGTQGQQRGSTLPSRSEVAKGTFERRPRRGGCEPGGSLGEVRSKQRERPAQRPRGGHVLGRFKDRKEAREACVE